MPPIADIIADLERSILPALAADWDNVGLLLGDRSASVDRLMTCLTVTPRTAAEAVAGGCQLIISHHPVLFKAVKRLTADQPEGAMLLALLRAGVAVHSPHTALDNAGGGINDLLADRLGLIDRRPLRPIVGPRTCKIVVFVPEADREAVADALFAAGAGVIGNYQQCGFRVAGTGSFLGSEASNPTIGQKGRREEAAEWRLEVVCPEERIAAAVSALRRAHSYEEPAFDVVPLRPANLPVGIGRVGQLPRPMMLHELAATVRQVLACGPVAFVGGPDRMVEHLAVVCGAGGDLLDDAVKARADALLTGEVRYHDCLRAEQHGLALVLPGHHASERPGVEALAERLAERWAGVTVWASRAEADPMCWSIGDGQASGGR